MIKNDCFRVSFLALVIFAGCLLAPAWVEAQTVAYWRFEEGPVDSLVTREDGTEDISGNGNTLYAWETDNYDFGMAYRTDVPSATIPGYGDATNSFSLQNTGWGPMLNTRSDESFPTGIDLETWTPVAFTIEASVKPEMNSNYMNIVGRDGLFVNDNNPDDSPLSVLITPDRSLMFTYADDEGNFFEAISEPDLVPGWPWPDSAAIDWCHVVVQSDGQKMSAYLYDKNSEIGWELVAQTDLTEEYGVSDPQLTLGESSGGDWHAGGWSVARGLYAGAHMDRLYGFVDEVRISEGALDPNEWLFAKPITIMEHPEKQIVDNNGTAVFDVNVVSDGSLSYQWYVSDIAEPNSGQMLSGKTGSSLTIEDASYSDEGYYYCRITETGSGYSVVTRSAPLAIGRMMAYWTMDQADYNGSSYIDVSTEDPVSHNADVNGTPDFVAGMIGDGVEIDPEINNGWATVGSFNPSEYSNEFTVSFWFNWDGAGFWQTLVSKRNAWAPDAALWQFIAAADSSNLWFESNFTRVWVDNMLTDNNQWQHLAIVFDGSDGAIYVDGQRRALMPLTLSNNPDASFNIGSSLGAETANGAFDDMKVFNYALTDVEIADMYFTETGERPCIEDNRPELDWSGNCVVDFADFAEIANQWMFDGRFVPEN